MEKSNTYYDALKQTRGSWNGLNPVTKIIPNKKKIADRNTCRKKSNLE